MKAVEYGTLLRLQESTATKKPLGVWEESRLYQAPVSRNQPSQRQEPCKLPQTQLNIIPQDSESHGLNSGEELVID